MKSKKQKISAGKLLISSPNLSDFFTQSVILMMEYESNGSLGFVINKEIDKKLHDIVEDFPAFDAKVMLGGPVQTEIVNFIHRAGELLEGGIEICDGIFWGGNFESLKELIHSGKLNPDDFIFFLGYSGWSAGQLDDEIRRKTWIITSAEKKIIFDTEAKNKWSDVLKNMGGKYITISSFPIDPSVN